MSDNAVNEVKGEAQQTASLAEAGRLLFLEGAKLRFSRAGAALRLTIEGRDKPFEQVSARRAFPLSLPTRHFSIRDDAGKEIGILSSLDGLDAESRSLLEAEIERRYMVSIIHKVIKVTERFGTVDWDVETHRGPCRFTTRDMRENSILVGSGHYLLTDVENNRFEVPDMSLLDARSQSLLMRHL